MDEELPPPEQSLFAAEGYGEDEDGSALPQQTSDTVPGLDELLNDAAAAREVQADYFVAITRVGRNAAFRRLHLLASNCPSKPRLGLANFEWVASPAAAHYDAVCRRCWPANDYGKADLVEAQAAGEGIKTDDSSSGSEEPSSEEEGEPEQSGASTLVKETS